MSHNLSPQSWLMSPKNTFYPATDREKREEAIFRDCLGCTLLLTALHQMRVPTDRDYRSKMKKSLKLSPGFAQKTTRDIILHATLLFLLCSKMLGAARSR